MKKIPVLVLSVCALSSFHLLAAEPSSLTLEECQRIAMEHNKQYLAALKEKERADLNYNLAWQIYMPKLSANFTYTLAEKLRAFEIPEDSPLYQFMNLAGEISFVIDFTYDYNVQLNIVQPIVNTQIILGIDSAALGRKLAEEKVRQVKNSVLYNVRNAFYRALLVENLVEVAREALKLAEEQLRVTQARYKVGEAMEFELLRNEVEVANARTALIEAENNQKKALLYLLLLMGLNTSQLPEIQGQLEKPRFSGTEDEYIAIALKKRPELKQIDLLIQIKKREKLTHSLEYAPSLNAIGTLNLFTNDINGRWHNDYNFMLALSWNLFTGGTSYTQLKSVEVEIEKLFQQRKLLEDTIRMEVKNAFLDLKKSSQLLAATEEAVKTAQRSVEIARERFRNGLLTSLELMDAQMALRRARTAYYNAIYQYTRAVEKIHFAAGIMDSYVEGEK